MPKNMCYSYDDLFRAVKRREMTKSEAGKFEKMSLKEKNDYIKKLAKEGNNIFKTKDVKGSDGKTYTSFAPTARKDIPPGMSFEAVEHHILAANCVDVVNGNHRDFRVEKTQDKSGPLISIDFNYMNLSVHLHMNSSWKEAVSGHLVLRGSSLEKKTKYTLTTYEMAMVLHHYIEK